MTSTLNDTRLSPDALGRPRHRAPRRLRGPLIVLGVVLVGLLLPVALVAGNAWATKRGVEGALDALVAGDIDAATAHARDARDDARDMDRLTFGLSGLLWSVSPQSSQDRADVRRLSDALVAVTEVVSTAADAYPADHASRGFLLTEGGAVDVVALQAVLDEFGPLRRHVASALASSRQVEGSTVLLGPLLTDTASVIQDQLGPVQDGMTLARPLVPVLPRILGGEGRQSLLVALLNPAEQRFSGGASLSFMPITLEDGRVREGETVIGAEDETTFAPFLWPPVEGNPFHDPGQQLRLSTATLAPSWSVSGEELLRAWEGREGGRLDGVVAVDVVALQDLMRFTGPIEVPGYGTLDADNLATKLVGSYEELTSPAVFHERRSGGAQLVAEFQKRVMAPSRLFSKLESAVASGRSRRISIYYRDQKVARAMQDMGVAGDLSPTRHDYVGVFNQATTGHKADFWQRRRMRHFVTLRPDGSAQVQLEVTIDNDSPRPARGVDPIFSAYVRRDNEMSLAAFLPIGAEDLEVQVDGEQVNAEREIFRGRPFVRQRLTFAPQESHTLDLSYDVPRAAEKRDGGLRYFLDVDPQSLVDLPAYSVALRWPDGYRPRRLPEGWSSGDDDVARFTTANLASSPRWRIEFSRGPG